MPLQFLLIFLISSNAKTVLGVSHLLSPDLLHHLNEQSNSALLKSISNGAQMAMDECKNVFKWEQWNCPQSAFSKSANYLMTKERAYIDAITSAAIIYSITKDCSQGLIKDCGCDNNMEKYDSEKSELKTDWRWGGCSDDPTYAQKILSKILEKNKGGDIQSFVNKHNHKIGHDIITEHMEKKCLCHGVSGSCSFQTCWKQMPSFHEIAKEIKRKYNNAIRISFEQEEGTLAVGNSAKQLNGEVLSSNHLVYLEKSPDFCKNNEATGWPGTKGRACSKTGSGSQKRSCRNLCRACGFKVMKQNKTVSFRCRCKFIWCCEVKCETCVQTVEEYFCN